MTKARKATLALLRQAEQPLSATEIVSRLTLACDPVTIYRTLHYLEDHGFADSFILHCTEHGTERYYTATDSSQEHHFSHHHWFHCEKCHRFIDFGNCQLKALVDTYEREHGLKVTGHTLYFTGICPSCSEPVSQPANSPQEHREGI